MSRIKFRNLQLGDTKKLYEIYSDKEAMKFRGSKPMESIEDAIIFVQNQRMAENEVLTIRKGIELVESRELIGSVMYRYRDASVEECEIGYSIGHAFWGQGLGKEIVNILVSDLRKNKTIKRIIAWSNRENIASIKILEKNNFHLVEQAESTMNKLYVMNLS
ncbi:MAG: GNAT family N-acetyltransferase [Chitinophagales bacterium]|nr:GNAT family N-acetyltransferase [Chitinophagales bacterium]